MSTTTATAKPTKAPPDERFWKKYSPHYELPISSATSVVLHALILALLVLGGLIAARLGLTRDNSLPPAESIVISGGGGHKDGVGTGDNTGFVPKGKEAVEPTNDPPKVGATEPPPEQLKDVKPDVSIPLPDKTEQAANRTVAASIAVMGNLSRVGKEAQAKLDGIIAAGKGRGGAGKGGGLGKGDGPGVGDAAGPGNQRIEKRQKRQLRWTMQFSTQNGQDYLRQLHSLGAILAIPGPEGKYVVIRNLLRRPPELLDEDVAALNRIYWVDDRPESVASLTRALSLSLQPNHFAAFFPESLEKELLDKELEYLRRRHRNRSEDDIKETRFQVLPRGGGYSPVVVSQTLN
jgi:hypothetical protein